MKKLFIFAALAAVAMTSCSKDDNTAAVSEEGVISMRAVVDKTASRAAAMTVDRFTSFHVQASKVGVNDLSFLNSAVYSLDKGSNWQYSPKAY